MTLDRIWSGWRSAYVAGEGADSRAAFDLGAGAPSVFTQLLESGLSDDETHIVHRGPTCFAVMNAFPYTSGHLMVLPYREIADLTSTGRRRDDRVVGVRHLRRGGGAQGVPT